MALGRGHPRSGWSLNTLKPKAKYLIKELAGLYGRSGWGIFEFPHGKLLSSKIILHTISPFEYLTTAASFMVVMVWNHYINLQVSSEYCFHSWSWTSWFRCKVTCTSCSKSVQLFWLDTVGSVSLPHPNYRSVPHLRRERRIQVSIALIKIQFYCLGPHFPLLFFCVERGVNKFLPRKSPCVKGHLQGV